MNAASWAIELRPASQKDEPYLLALRQETMNEHFARLGDVPTRDEHLDRLRQHYEDIRIITCASEAVGMVKAYRSEAEWVLSQVQIAPAHQRKGLGEQIIRLILGKAIEDSLPVRLDVLNGNPACRLYERLGFVEVEAHGRAATLVWRP